MLYHQWAAGLVWQSRSWKRSLGGYDCLALGAEPGQSKAPSPTFPWQLHSAYCSHNRSCSKETALENKMCWDHLLIHGLNQLRSLYKLLRFWKLITVIYFSYGLLSLVCKFPCLLKLPPTSLKWPASFFGHSLPSVYETSLKFYPENSRGCTTYIPKCVQCYNVLLIIFFARGHGSIPLWIPEAILTVLKNPCRLFFPIIFPYCYPGSKLHYWNSRGSTYF